MKRGPFCPQGHICPRPGASFALPALPVAWVFVRFGCFGTAKDMSHQIRSAFLSNFKFALAGWDAQSRMLVCGGDLNAIISCHH